VICGAKQSAQTATAEDHPKRGVARWAQARLNPFKAKLIRLGSPLTCWPSRHRRVMGGSGPTTSAIFRFLPAVRAARQAG